MCRDANRGWRALAVACGVALAIAGCGRSDSDGPAAVEPAGLDVAAAPTADRGAAALDRSGIPPTQADRPLEIEPAAALLRPGDLGLQFAVRREGDRGGWRDRTADVTWTAEPEGVVAIEPNGFARPVGSGTVVVTASTPEGDTAEAELTVESAANRPWDFDTDIVPILTHVGCNTGSCHGATEGKKGFHLSLFGYDAEADYLALTREAGGRRIDPLEPDQSLALLKPSGQVPHGGGKVLAVDSDAYRTLRDWIAAGAPKTRGESHGPVVAVEVRPSAVQLETPGPLQLRVVARYADGHERDVTRWAAFQVGDESAVAIDDHGHAELLRRAETDLIVRYQTEVVSSRVATLINPDLEFDFDALPRRNVIDEELFRRLAALKVPPSPPADDAAFLRRVTLDLIGQQPRPDQIRAFLEDDDPEKRARVVDELMERPYFIDHWLIKLGDMLQISQARFGNGRGLYEGWVKKRLRENMPWDEFVRTLLTATGDPLDPVEGGPVNYAVEGQDAKERAELTAQRFLGQRFRCAQCHDHPFDVWTQDDYYGLAAFFAKVGRDYAPGMMGGAVTVNPEGFIEHPRTGERAVPKFPHGETVEPPPDQDPRQALAAWITAPENPYFARATANWVWAQFFGKGLAEPADDLGAANPPVHPELLDALAEEFIESGYDLRHLIRLVATSETYGLSSSPVPGNEQDTRLFSHQTPRPLTAHQMADALAQATDTPNRFDLSRGQGGVLVERRAVEVSDPAIPSTLLDAFGRCPRANGCSPVSTPTLSLKQSLMLVGGTVIEDRIARFDGYLANLLEFEPTPEEIVENLYMRTLCRKPSEHESAHWSELLASADSLREASEDLFWALLNSREFAFNH